MQTPVEIRYAGVVLGVSEQARADHLPGSASPTVFIAFAEPLPVGTRLELRTPSGTHTARVEGVVETGVTGMRVSLGDAVDAGGVPEATSAEADASGFVEAGGADSGADDATSGEAGKKKRRRKR